MYISKRCISCKNNTTKTQFPRITTHHMSDSSPSCFVHVLEYEMIYSEAFFTHIKTQSCSPEPEEYKYKHHLKFLRPDELNSKNKWLVKSGSEPCAHSFTKWVFHLVGRFLSLPQHLLLGNLNTASI